MAANRTEAVTLPRPIGRLAPSPTGTLHLGNARTFLLAWLSIRQQSGTLVLRIEDIDADRTKPGAVEAVIDDLHWLGLDWDYGPGSSTPSVGSLELVQSKRLDRYRQVLQQLVSDRCLYRCDCSRSQIARSISSAPHESGLHQLEGPVYPGNCRWRRDNAELSEDFFSQDLGALRWAFAPGEIHWTDQLLGPQSATPMKQIGDFVVARTNGHPSYQLAVVVDDHDLQVSEVIRGNDLVVSTFRQQAILQHFGWPSPLYYHVPLIVGPDGSRLAKRKGDSLAELRRQQIRPESVVGFLAASLGLIQRREPVTPKELLGTLRWDRIQNAPTVYSGSTAELP
jgi:glutamyl-tRNA synthetase